MEMKCSTATASAPNFCARERFLPLGDGENSRYLLVELSPDDSFSRLQDAVSQVTRMGYRPVIAHVERYQCMYRQKDRFEELQRQGTLFQVNYNQAKREPLALSA